MVRIDTLDNVPPYLCDDGLGGVIMAWQEYEGGVGHVRVQRIDGAGVTRWDAGGVRACTLSTMQAPRACLAVGQSRFVVGWFGGDGAWQHRAQMFDLAGNRRWGPAGMPVSGALGSGSGSVGLPAESAGRTAWIWTENRTGTDDLFAQKLDSTGVRCWDSAGVWLGTSDTSEAQVFSATTDGRGGALVAWPLYRGSRTWDVYAQRVDSAGHLCWSDTGIGAGRDIALQLAWIPYVVTDGDGGAIIAWKDDRGIYAQRVADGAGIAEGHKSQAPSRKLEATVTRGVLFLEEATSHKPQATNLLNVCGRDVMVLHGGANDVSRLAPGVYFVRRAQAQAQAQVVRKVVIAR